MAKKPSIQQVLKHFIGRCLLCGEDCRECLNAHRPAEGQKYCQGNIFVCCANCHHGKIHSGKVKITGRYQTSMGYHVWRVVMEDGREEFIPDLPPSQEK